DHLIRSLDERRRDRQAEGLGGFEVDDQLELRRLLDWEVRGLRALEDLVHIGGRSPKRISEARSIGHEAPDIDEIPRRVHGRQAMLCRQVHEASSLAVEDGAPQYGQSADARPGHLREGPVELGGTLRLNELKPYSQGPCCDFCWLQHVCASAEGTWLPEDSDQADLRNGLLELFQTLADELRSDVGQPREIAAGVRQAGDEPVCDRIGGRAEDNREDPRRFLGRQGGGCASTGHDDINLERNQFGRKSREPLDLPLGRSVFDHDVAALDVAEVVQSLEEGPSQVGVSVRDERQEAYSRGLGRHLLRLGSERRDEEATTEGREERTSIQH